MPAATRGSKGVDKGCQKDSGNKSTTDKEEKQQCQERYEESSSNNYNTSAEDDNNLQLARRRKLYSELNSALPATRHDWYPATAIDNYTQYNKGVKDREPRPAQQRKLTLAATNSCLKQPCKLNQSYCLESRIIIISPSTAQFQIDDI